MSTEEMNIQELESQFNEQERLRREKLVQLQEVGKDPFDVYKVNRTHSSQQVKDNFEELEGKDVTVAGRIMSKRGQGKVVFSDIYDRDGRIQLFIKIDEVGEEELKQYMSISDLFVHPTREDIWGLVINEAMSYGLPVLTTNMCVAGVELLPQTCIVRSEDVNGLKEKILEVIYDNDELKRMSDRNLEKIKKYTIEEMVNNHINIFNTF